MKCGSCGHWVAPSERERDMADLQLGRCSATAFYSDAQEWSKEGKNVLKAEFANTTAFAMDESGYYASLRTKAQHFCAMYAPASQETPDET